MFFGSANTSQSARGRFYALLCVFIVAILNRASFAGGSPDEFARLPQQIQVSELEQYRQWMNLSAAQWHAMCIAYLEYLRGFEALKPEIGQYLAPPPKYAQTISEGIQMMQDGLRENHELRAKIGTLDDQLFGSVQSMLADTQLPGWQRMRDHRKRHSAQVQLFLKRSGWPLLDLTELARTVEWGDADRQAVEQILIPYEQAMTPLIVKLEPGAPRWFLEMQIELKKLAYEDDAKGPPYEVYAPIAAKIQAPLIKMAREIDDLNDRTIAQIEAVVSPEGRDRWRDKYFPEVDEDLSEIWQRRSRIRHALAGFADEQRAAAEAVIALYESRTQPWLDRMLASAKAVHERHSPYDTDMLERQKAYSELDYAARLDTRSARMKLADDLQSALGGGARASFLAEYDQLSGMRSPDAMPSLTLGSLRISPQQIQTWCEILELDAGQIDQVTNAHREYLTAIDAAPAPKPLEKSSTHRVAAPELVKALSAFDQRLFTQVSSIVEEPAKQRVFNCIRQTRERMLLRSQGLNSTLALRIDVGEFLLNAALPPQKTAGMADLIDGYHSQAMPFCTQWAGASLKLDQTDANSDYEMEVAPLWTELNHCQQRLANLNIATMKQACDVLDDPALRDRFNRTCFREVFADPATVSSLFSAAMQLPDVAAEAKARILELSLEYQSQYDTLTQQMIDQIGDSVGWVRGDDGQLVPSCKGCAQGYRKHRFDREELNALTRLKLTALLTPEQAQAIALSH